MEQRILELRAKLLAAPANRRGHRKYPITVVNEAISLGQAWVLQGKSLRSLSTELGCSEATLHGWMKRDRSTRPTVKSRFKPVRLVEPTSTPIVAHANRFAMLIRDDVRIDGLSVHDIADLLRKLGPCGA